MTFSLTDPSIRTLASSGFIKFRFSGSFSMRPLTSALPLRASNLPASRDCTCMSAFRFPSGTSSPSSAVQSLKLNPLIFASSVESGRAVFSFPSAMLMGCASATVTSGLSFCVPAI